jgi:hypothetical protein
MIHIITSLTNIIAQDEGKRERECLKWLGSVKKDFNYPKILTIIISQEIPVLFFPKKVGIFSAIQRYLDWGLFVNKTAKESYDPISL